MTTTSQTGTCQVCERECKIVRGAISLHGYNRPGTGEIHGRCPGAKRLPLEVACDALAEYVSMLDLTLAGQRAGLAYYLDPALEEVTVHDISLRRGVNTSTTHRRGVLTVNSWGCTVEEFKIVVAGRIQKAEQSIRQTEREGERQGARLAAWSPAQ